jgi:hypothetical protein
MLVALQLQVRKNLAQLNVDLAHATQTNHELLSAAKDPNTATFELNVLTTPFLKVHHPNFLKEVANSRRSILPQVI